MSIPWLYFYSEELYNKVIQDTVKGYNLKGIQSDTFADKASKIAETLRHSESPYIIVSDSDLVIKPGVENELSNLKDDMVFLSGPDNTFSSGIMRLKVSSDVIQFWETITTLHESLPKFTGSISKFSNKFTSSDTWDRQTDFYVLKVIPTNLGKEYNFAETVFTMAQYMDFQKYMEYVPENVVPFIYKIQELLFLTHKEMKHAD
jgi:hypothetical protein